MGGACKRQAKTCAQLVLCALLYLLSPSHAVAESPNFLVIVADDMGWSDLGSRGSEIATPTLDALAANGLSMSRFYAGPTCSPTRAMLLTGVDSHLAGLGTMAGVQAPNQLSSKGYIGGLNDNVATLAEVLKNKGYATLMSGKWHLGKAQDQLPSRRGFDQSFTLLEGGASHFSDAAPLYKGIKASYLENGRAVALPEDFYSSSFYVTKLLEYLEGVDEGKPFFAYLAFTAPHDPLHVPDDWVQRYRGKYDAGPRAMRQRRIDQLQALGMVPAKVEATQPPNFPSFMPMHIKPWNDMTSAERLASSRPMEIYAAMIELMDREIGRVLNTLKARGLADNTYILFLSDNGANGATPLSYPNSTRTWFHRRFDHSLAQQGRVNSHPYVGREWAAVSSAPFKLYKGAVTEGGIRVPFIVSGPGIGPGGKSDQLAHVTDIPRTLYELAGVTEGDLAKFDHTVPLEGLSLRDHWRQGVAVEGRTFATELFGHGAVITERWKAVNLKPPLGSGKWQLYDLARDPGETVDLAEQFPAELESLVEHYNAYVQRVGVIPPAPPVAISVGDLFTGECGWLCRVMVSAMDALMAFWQAIR